MTAKKPILVWVVWAVAVLLYAVAIINRTSLAALGPAAQEHFAIGATTLSSFAVLQLGVYALMQIPVGLLVDRFGATVIILSGSALMVVGQTLMATMVDLPFVVLARILVGAGDAGTFISVMRILGDWFPLRQLPVVSQITALLGQAGQLVAVTPLALAVAAFGWTKGFLGIAAVGLLSLLLAVVTLRDRPGSGTALERLTGRRGRATAGAEPMVSYSSVLTDSIPIITATGPIGQPQRSRDIIPRIFGLLRIPGVRLAFWAHFTPPFAINVFVLLWGTPFLTGGIGLSRSESAGILSIAVVASMIAGLLIGPITSRFVNQRIWVVFGVTLSIALLWSVVIFGSGVPATGLVIVLMILVAFGGPTSMIAFEIVRTHAPSRQLGVATGLVNTGGFTASLLCILLVGLALDLQGAGSPEFYSLDAFRWAFAVQLPFWALGLTMILVEFV
ncbi:MFS transporter, partial [Leucobacter sp. M11]|uniref:MFS transporter n=1 Tax=Leucobacter sp. M11 TaxID=2993565 RepID=UPI002D806791